MQLTMPLASTMHRSKRTATSDQLKHDILKTEGLRLYRPPSAEGSALKELQARCNDLVVTLNAEGNRLEHARRASVIRSLKAILRQGSEGARGRGRHAGTQQRCLRQESPPDAQPQGHRARHGSEWIGRKKVCQRMKIVNLANAVACSQRDAGA